MKEQTIKVSNEVHKHLVKLRDTLGLTDLNEAVEFLAWRVAKAAKAKQNGIRQERKMAR